MATPFAIRHEFDCDVATYWDIFWDERFNDDQYRATHCDRRVLRLTDEGETRYRDQEIRPQRGLPGPLSKLMGSATLSYIERAIFHKPAGPLAVTVEVPVLGERFFMQGDYRVEATTEGHCRREFRGECAVRIPLLGGRAEQLIVQEMTNSYGAAASTHRDWIRRRAAGPSAP